MEKRWREKRVSEGEKNTEEEEFSRGKTVPHEHGKEAEEEECFLRILHARMLFIQLFNFEKVLPVDRHHLFICIRMYIYIYTIYIKYILYICIHVCVHIYTHIHTHTHTHHIQLFFRFFCICRFGDSFRAFALLTFFSTLVSFLRALVRSFL